MNTPVRHWPILILLILIVPASVASEPSTAEQNALLAAAVQRGEGFWRQVEKADPSPSTSCRGLLSYALLVSEARVHPERLQRLFVLARQMQDQDPKSKYWGNLRWYWRDAGVTDTNAVEFCMQDALLIEIRHGDWLPAEARMQLGDLIRLGADGCLRHRVPTQYTNMAILNAGNLIVMGQRLHRDDAASEGSRRLDALCACTAARGIHEFCSPTYYCTDLDGLLLIYACAQGERPRRQAGALLNYVWTDIAANWFPAAENLGGCHSRSYDYLRGIGALDWHFWVHGWLESSSAGGAERREPWSKEWAPPPALLEMARRLPRAVRQRWGALPAECRSHVLFPDVALSSCGACYGNQDATLVVDLAGGRDKPRCYFIADGREDPYGKMKYETGSARHLKALHMQPFWAGSQSGTDALGLVVYRARDVTAAEVTRVQSHFVLRRSGDVWLNGKRVKLPPGTADKPSVVAVPVGGSLVLHYGTAAIGLRVPWLHASKGTPASVSLVDDGNAFDCLRLTVDHGRKEDLLGVSAGEMTAGVAFWVRVGSGLNREAFDAWRKEFDLSPTGDVAVSANRLQVAVPGKEGPLSIVAHPPWDQDARVEIVPKPYQGVLEVDGKELGRPLLAAVEPLCSWPAGKVPAVGPLACMTVPAGKAFYWEAETGLILPGMAVGKDAGASGGRYVGQESTPIGQPGGSVTWSLAIERPCSYWLWARVRSADARHGSVSFRAIGEDGAVMPAATWPLRSEGKWRWQPLKFEGANAPVGLVLSKGVYQIELQTRQSGTMIDRLMLTTDPQERP